MSKHKGLGRGLDALLGGGNAKRPGASRVDDELESLGYDQVRSRIRIMLKNGRTIEGRNDVARGHPEKPMSWAELGEKFRDCAALVLPEKKADDAIELVARIDELRSLRPLLRALSVGHGKSLLKGRNSPQRHKVHRVRKIS